MRAFLKIISFITIAFGLFITVFFFIKLSNQFTVLGQSKIEMNATGQVGDFIGGVVGTIFSLAGFLVLFITLSEQTKFTNKERFESKFFDLLKLHRENVAEMSRNNTNGRKEFHKIYMQFLECREDMKPIFRRKKENDIYDPDYLIKLKNAFKYTNPNIDLVELAKFNLPYLVTFYGVNSDGRQAIYDILEGKYKKALLEKAVEYIAMKPVMNSKYYDNWKQVQKLEIKQRVPVMQIIRQIRNSESVNNTLERVQIAEKNFYKSDYVKYYGGHQFQLGHYFRHLFQTYCFINKQRMKNSEKYFYAKTLRAQLSTHEQCLLFINSISTLGLAWDLVPKIKPSSREVIMKKRIKKSRLITNFNIIKNIPGREIFGIDHSKFYPGVKFEHIN